ncbi:MAG TPA: SCO family protein, partial [Solirubrobacteraceae bacterium]
MPARVRLALMVAATLALLGALGVVLLARQDGGPALGTQGFAGALRPAIPPRDFTLRDQDGRRVSLAAQRGRVTVLTFLYSTCQDTCPAQVQTIRQALDDTHADVNVVGITVDPKNDTRKRATTFLVKQTMLGRMRFLLGTRAQLEPVWKA